METKYMLNIQRLNELMDERGWGPGELATYSGIKYDTIYKLRTGDRPGITADVVAKLAVALRTSMEYLLGITDKRQPYALNTSATMLKVVNVGDRLPTSRQRDLLRIAKGFEDAIEETQRERDLALFDRLMEIADKAGRGDEIDQVLSERLKTLLSENGSLGESGDDQSDNEAGDN